MPTENTSPVVTVDSIVEDPAFKKAMDAMEAKNTESVVEHVLPQSGKDALSTDSSKDAASDQLPPAEGLTPPPAGGAVETDGAETPDWIDDEIKDLAKSYGINDARLAKFSSLEDFQNAATLYDEQLVAGRNKPDASVMVDPITGEPVGAAKPIPESKPETKAEVIPPVKAGRFDIAALKAKNFDEDSLALFEQANANADRAEKLQQELEKVVPVVEQMQQQREQAARAQQQQIIYQYHSTVDTLAGHEDRFGKFLADDGKIQSVTADQKANRDRLYATADAMATQLHQAGRPLPPMGALLKRALAVEFGTELLAEKSKQVRADLTKQSATRRPVGTNRPVVSEQPKTGASINDHAKYILSNPEFNRQFNLIESAGATR